MGGQIYVGYIRNHPQSLIFRMPFYDCRYFIGSGEERIVRLRFLIQFAWLVDPDCRLETREKQSVVSSDNLALVFGFQRFGIALGESIVNVQRTRANPYRSLRPKNSQLCASIDRRHYSIGIRLEIWYVDHVRTAGASSIACSCRIQQFTLPVEEFDLRAKLRIVPTDRIKSGVVADLHHPL